MQITLGAVPVAACAAAGQTQLERQGSLGKGKLMQDLVDLAAPRATPHEAETIPVFARWFGSWRISVQRRALSGPELTRFYDSAAPRWSRTLDRLGFPDAYETLLRKVLRQETPSVSNAQRRVLDCGVGTGALSCALARMSPDRFTLDAIDISPRMLERAGNRLRSCDLKATLRKGDLRKLPYGDGVFDLVMTAHVLEHLADPSVAGETGQFTCHERSGWLV